MRFRRHYSITKGQLNLTPLIDMIFLQLIYFMLTSSFIMQPGIKINLPQAATAETVTEKEIMVSISREGALFHGDSPVTLEELERILYRQASLEKNTTLIVKGDRKAEHGTVVYVMDLARKTGINKIAVATTPEF